MAGFAFFGRAPVMCSASADLIDHLAAEHRAEQQAEHVNSFVGDAVEQLLHSADDRDVLYVLATEAGNIHRRVALDRIYSRETGECEADSQDEWTRVMLMAAPEHLPMLRQQWIDWCEGQLAENPEVVKVAQRLADKSERDRADSVAAERAEARADL